MAQRLTPAQIAAMARARGLDPNAVLRVASAEGLSGGIGDSGHAFGPFQENDAGGVLTGRFPGMSAAQKQAWAWSPAGVADALSRIGAVAKGRTGADAVRAIVTKFERPADPQGEIIRALSSGAAAPASSPDVPAAAPSSSSPVAGALAGQPPQPDPRVALLQALAGVKGGDFQAFYRQLGASRQQREAALPQTANAPDVRNAPSPLTGPGYTGQPGAVTGAVQGENPQFLKDLAALAGYRKQPVAINSGYRSMQDQERLWAARGSNPNPVAKPGTSLHEKGLAADGTIGGVPIGTLPAALLRRFGLAPVPGDPVHVQILR